jgi:hypothetical protein
MAGGTFSLGQILQVVDRVSGAVQFPLTDAAALEAGADFFPIACREDLFTKLAFLRSASGDQPDDLITGGRQVPLPPGVTAPSQPRTASLPAGRNAPSAIPHH